MEVEDDGDGGESGTLTLDFGFVALGFSVFGPCACACACVLAPPVNC